MWISKLDSTGPHCFGPTGCPACMISNVLSQAEVHSVLSKACSAHLARLCKGQRFLFGAAFPFPLEGIASFCVFAQSPLCSSLSYFKLSARALKFLSRPSDSSEDVFIPFSSETSCLEPSVIFQSRLVAPEAGC